MKMKKEFLEIKKQLTHFDMIDCPLCWESYKNTRTLFKNDNWLSDHKRICKKCWLIYQSPRRTESDTNIFYNKFYLKNYFSPYCKIVSSEKIHFNHWFLRIDEINLFYEEIKRAKKPIEIWCSSGWVLKALSAINPNFYWIDIDDDSIKYAKDQWLNAENKSLFDLKNNTYDFAIMSHVCEHLLDPDSFLKKINDILVEWGLFLIFVPDSYKTHEWPHVPHTFCFTDQTLISMVTKHWFIVNNNVLYKNRPQRFKKDIIILFQKSNNSKQILSYYSGYKFNIYKLQRILIRLLEITRIKKFLIKIFKLDKVWKHLDKKEYSRKKM